MENKWFTGEGNTLLKCSTEAKGQIESLGGYIKVAYEAFKGCNQITKVTLPSSATSIGTAAFAECTNLVAIDLSATHLVFLPEALFDNCKNLQKIYLPNTIREISDFAFRGCASLKQIELPDSIQRIGEYAFAGCSSLTEITNIPEKIDFGQMAFAGCINLRQIDFPSHNTEVPFGLFLYCKSLEEIRLGDKIGRIEDHAFDGCLSLKSVSLPNIDYVGAYAFRRCVLLNDIRLGNSLDNIAAHTFEGCDSLQSIHLSSVSTIGYYAFSKCVSLKEIKLGDNIECVEDHAFDGCVSLHNINLPNVCGIEAYAFRNCISLEVVEIGDKVQDIELCAFNGCKNLHNVRISNNDIDWVGSDTSLIRNTLDNLGVELIERLFEERTKMEGDDGLTHPHSLETKTPLQVKSIVLSSNSDVITQDDVESICSEENVKYKITIPDGIRQIDNDAFMCCKIEDIDIPESVREIGESAFNDTGLSVFKCPKGITKIESGTYAGNNINVVVIPKHINYIGEYAFNANPIEKIIIKNPDCEICLGAFFIGDGLKELHLKNSIPPKNIVDWFWSDVPTDCRPEYFSDCVLYVPKGTAYLYYRHKEKPDYDLLDASWDYSNPYLFFKDIVEE